MKIVKQKLDKIALNIHSKVSHLITLVKTLSAVKWYELFYLYMNSNIMKKEAQVLLKTLHLCYITFIDVLRLGNVVLTTVLCHTLLSHCLHKFVKVATWNYVHVVVSAQTSFSRAK